MRQSEQLGLGHAVLCAARAVGDDPFAVLLADDFLTDNELGVTADLVSAFEKTGKSQISIMAVEGADVSKYGILVLDGVTEGIVGLIEKPTAAEAPSNLASIGRYVLTPDIFETLSSLSADSGGEIQLADAINIHAQKGKIGAVYLSGRRFDCGSVEGFLSATLHEAERRKA